MGQTIFISYRRDDAASEAGRNHDRLVAEFGGDNIFVDVDNIPLGERFADVIAERIAASDVLLAVIGRDWLDASDDNGRRRLDDPEDFVRMELAEALEAKLLVIPILVQGSMTPRADTLPDAIRDLSGRQALRVDHETFHADLSRLVAQIRRRPKLIEARSESFQGPSQDNHENGGDGLADEGASDAEHQSAKAADEPQEPVVRGNRDAAEKADEGEDHPVAAAQPEAPIEETSARTVPEGETQDISHFAREPQRAAAAETDELEPGWVRERVLPFGIAFLAYGGFAIVMTSNGPEADRQAGSFLYVTVAWLFIGFLMFIADRLNLAAVCFIAAALQVLTAVFLSASVGDPGAVFLVLGSIAGAFVLLGLYYALGKR
ncbi:MAG: toll/interleukin-1 receptor domain-containing protein [Pseudomonadota bacterium]